MVSRGLFFPPRSSIAELSFLLSLLPLSFLFSPWKTSGSGQRWKRPDDQGQGSPPPRFFLSSHRGIGARVVPSFLPFTSLLFSPIFFRRIWNGSVATARKDGQKSSFPPFLFFDFLTFILDERTLPPFPYSSLPFFLPHFPHRYCSSRTKSESQME